MAGEYIGLMDQMNMQLLSLILSTPFRNSR
jgi:hypothetical protein